MVVDVNLLRDQADAFEIDVDGDLGASALLVLFGLQLQVTGASKSKNTTDKLVYIIVINQHILPVTNCTSERSFSHLRRIKSALKINNTNNNNKNPISVEH